MCADSARCLTSYVITVPIVLQFSTMPIAYLSSGYPDFHNASNNLRQKKSVKMSQKTIKDASILIHKLLTTKVEKEIITNLLVDLVEIYQQNEISIGTVDHITGKDVLNLNKTEFTQGDFKSLIEYVIDKRQDKLRRLLIHLLNQSPYQNDDILFKIISTMEDSLFIQTDPSWRKIKSTKQDENSFTLNLKFKMEPEKKFRNYTWPDSYMDRYFVAITNFKNVEELEERLTNIKLYQGLCCIYGFRRKTNPQELRNLFLPNQLSTEDEVQNVTRFLDTLSCSTGQEILVTVSSYYKISLKNWFTQTYEKRRIPSEEQVRLQVQVFQVLFRELQSFLTKGVTQVNLLPKNFFLSKLKGKCFFPSAFGLPDDQVSFSDFERLFISENHSNVRYSIGILMLYALAACDKDEFVDLVKLIKSEETELNLDALYSFSPILSTSKSIRTLIRDIIHSTNSLLPNEELCKMLIDWDGLFRDFEHNSDERAKNSRWDFYDDGAHMKLLVAEVLATVIDETYADLTIQELPEHELAEVCDKMRNEKYADFDENLLTKNTFQEVLDFAKNERPWILPPLLYNSRTYFTAELTSKLYKSTEKHWDAQFTNLSYLGANNFGYLFQRRQTIPNTLSRSRIMLLIPKVSEEEILGKIRTRTYGKLNFSVNLSDFSYFYDHLHLKPMYSDQLREIITPDELDSLPAQLQKILNARICVEVATIQFPVGRHTLRDYINYI
ncbi:uncharacterized protein LOC110863143 [Folsomia candida]|uniref:uncharacterized protein LOC110863143 n=1 Tax=Folsomia candida TaxID=158441 RepID=UPI0016050544|nr:uncharacterized protein LOC110863143 [Folsomia candida]